MLDTINTSCDQLKKTQDIVEKEKPSAETIARENLMEIVSEIEAGGGFQHKTHYNGLLEKATKLLENEKAVCIFHKNDKIQKRAYIGDIYI